MLFTLKKHSYFKCLLCLASTDFTAYKMFVSILRKPVTGCKH